MLIQYLERNGHMSENYLEQILGGDDEKVVDNFMDRNPNDVLVFGPNGKTVRARTGNQTRMVEACDKNDILFAIGPAGTGKTSTAVALAVRALKNKQVKSVQLDPWRETADIDTKNNSTKVPETPILFKVYKNDKWDPGPNMMQKALQRKIKRP